MIKKILFPKFCFIFNPMVNKRLPLITGALILLVLFFSHCIQGADSSKNTSVADPRGEAFAGSQTCIKCHKDIATSYFHSAHALTSQPADSSSVKGPFTKGQNEFSYGVHGKVVLEKRGSGLFQQVVRPAQAEEPQNAQSAVPQNAQPAVPQNAQPAVTRNAQPAGAQGPRSGEAHRFDITVGSGRKAQTYLYWEKDAVYELPVSYFVTEKAWANSPHYPSDTIWFGRAVATECFECHASYVHNKPAVHTAAFHQIDQYDRATLIYGIDCERCHGPAAQHVAWQTAHPEEKTAKYITSIKTLTRQQKLDICAACHSGAHTEQRSLFHFRPGQALANYFYAEPNRNPDLSTMDVHGNQYQLLTKSKCFLLSENLDCNTCHNTHVQEREDLTVFARRCETCHKPGSIITVAGTPAHKGIDSTTLITRCIDCHMPARASKAITMQTAVQRDPVADLVRTHLIAVYSGN